MSSVDALTRAVARLDNRFDCTPRDRRIAERLSYLLVLENHDIRPIVAVDPRDPDAVLAMCVGRLRDEANRTEAKVVELRARL